MTTVACWLWWIYFRGFGVLIRGWRCSRSWYWAGRRPSGPPWGLGSAVSVTAQRKQSQSSTCSLPFELQALDPNWMRSRFLSAVLMSLMSVCFFCGWWGFASKIKLPLGVRRGQCWSARPGPPSAGAGDGSSGTRSPPRCPPAAHRWAPRARVPAAGSWLCVPSEIRFAGLLCDDKLYSSWLLGLFSTYRKILGPLFRFVFHTLFSQLHKLWWVFLFWFGFGFVFIEGSWPEGNLKWLAQVCASGGVREVILELDRARPGVVIMASLTRSCRTLHAQQQNALFRSLVMPVSWTWGAAAQGGEGICPAPLAREWQSLDLNPALLRRQHGVDLLLCDATWFCQYVAFCITKVSWIFLLLGIQQSLLFVGSQNHV